MTDTTLARRLGPWTLTLYGVGTMVGGGFYALVGKVSAQAGMLTPWALLMASAVAGLSALCFAELSARFPSSAGESRYVEEAFGWRGLAGLVGWMVIATGVVSAATLARAFAGFLVDLVPAVPEVAGVVGILALLTLVAAWGIGESTALAIGITVVEVGGLVWALAVGWPALAALPDALPDLVALPDAAQAQGVALGAFLAFYAFVGFEDMVNLAEEVEDVERTLPWAILGALGITTVLYVAVGLLLVLAHPPEALAASATPLGLILGAEGRPVVAWAVGVISMLAGVNGALMQLVMAARVVYGLAARRLAPAWLGRVDPRTRTPVVGTVAAGLVAAALALTLDLVPLARLTSGVLLAVFALVAASLGVLQARDPGVRAGVVHVPRIVPWLSVLACLGFLALQLTGGPAGGH